MNEDLKIRIITSCIIMLITFVFIGIMFNAVLKKSDSDFAHPWKDYPFIVCKSITPDTLQCADQFNYQRIPENRN